MIVHNLDIGRTGRSPAKDNAPLIVHPDRMESISPTLQSLQPVARRNREIFDTEGAIHLDELPKGNA